MITFQQMLQDLIIREDLGEQLKETPTEMVLRMHREGKTRDSEYQGPETFKGAKEPKLTGIFAKIY